MTEEKLERGVLGFRDDRHFSLFAYRPQHSYAVVRGFPYFGDIEEGDGEGIVRDLFFTGVWRIACWKDIGPVHLRKPTQAEADILTSRLGEVRHGLGIFLLEPDSIESYVIAHGVSWADYEIMLGEDSPLTAPPGDRTSPVDGIVRFAE